MSLRLSVVIPTYRRPELVRRCLTAVLNQRIEPASFEIIVVDDGHDDATRDVVEALASQVGAAPRLRYVRPAAGCGPAVARNAGWRAAQAPLIAFTDDDTVPEPGWLSGGERAMAGHSEWSAVCGRVVVPRDGRDDALPTDHELMTRGLECAEFVTANAFVRRAALERVDGFDETFTRAWHEDSDLHFRLMKSVGPVGHADDAIVSHPVRAERWGVCLRQQRNAFFDALLYKKHRQLYRERIHPQPPWHYYAMAAAAAATPLLLLMQAPEAAATTALVWLALVLRFTWKRLRHTTRAPAHVVEMLATSALVPFLSIYWRLRGALHFKVLFL